MSQAIHLEVEVPDDLARLRLPEGVQQRLTELLDKQDEGTPLTGAEQARPRGWWIWRSYSQSCGCGRSG
jgi:hypothetical protein